MKLQDIRLMLVCGARGRMIPLATVIDPGFVRKAARRAVSEARSRAKFLGEIDPAFGATQRAEANRIAEVLSSVS